VVALKHAALPNDRGVLNPLLEKWQDGVRTIHTACSPSIARDRHFWTSLQLFMATWSRVFELHVLTGLGCCRTGRRDAGVWPAGGAGSHPVQVG
jgi:hypothetical protein